MEADEAAAAAAAEKAFNFSSMRASLEQKAASGKKVVVDLNEYYKQQGDAKRKDQRNRNEAETNLRSFHTVTVPEPDSSFPHESDADASGNNKTDAIEINTDEPPRKVQPVLLLKWMAALIISAGLLNESGKRRALTALPLVYHQNTEYNYRLQSLMSAVLLREYRPSLFIGTRSMLNSTVAYMKPGPVCPNRIREEVRMTRDGAIIALDWEFPRGCSNASKDYIENGPISQSIVLILHGVNPDTSFGYMRSMMNSCTKNGWIAVGLNARGCGGIDLATPRFANLAYTNDLR